MKKLFSIFMSAIVLAASLFSVNAADVRVVESFYPQNVIYGVAPSLVNNYQIKLIGGVPDNTSNVIVPATRTIKTNDCENETPTATVASIRSSTLGFRMQGDWSGSLRWKNSFVWKFDFNIDTLDHYIMFKFGNAAIKFIRAEGTDQYYINWDGNTDPDLGISHPLDIVDANEAGTLLRFNETYHIRIEANMKAGGGLHVIFTDPETGESRTSYMPHGVTRTQEEYTAEGSEVVYNTLIETKGRVYMETENEEMLMERIFITSHIIDAPAETAKVKATAVALSNVNQPFTGMPNLILSIYDSNKAMVKTASNNQGSIAKNSTERDKKLVEKCTFSAEIDVSDLTDGTYTAKSFIWKAPDDPTVCGEAVETEFTVADGAIVVTE